MNFSYFDIIVTLIILFLGLKGVINGFFKEFFGLLGIVGGIYIASRISGEIGGLLSDTIFKLNSNSAINFTGFIVTLIVFWSLMIIVGNIFKSLSSLGGLGVFDKILGFIFGAGKFFFIASVIVYAAFNIKTIELNYGHIAKNSVLIPLLREVGGTIMKLEPASQIGKNTDEAITKGTKEFIEQTQEAINTQIAKTLDTKGSNDAKD